MRPDLPIPRSLAARAMATAALLALLVACGGGDEPNGNANAADQSRKAAGISETSRAPAAEDTNIAGEGAKKALAATAPSAVLVTSTPLTVRAYGTLAGNVGPVKIGRAHV